MAENRAYKILSTGEFSLLHGAGAFPGSPADLADGYIHLSTASQLPGTLDKHYAGRTGLVIAAVDLTRVADILRWEVSRGGQLFPHLYGVLKMDAIIATAPLERLADGTPKLPA